MKQFVHNELEARVLIKEAYKRGDEERYQGSRWFTHTEEYLFKTEIRHTEYEMIFQDLHSVTVEVA